MIALKTPNGINVNVPENAEEDVSKKFSMYDIVNAKKYYDDNGYVIFRQVFEPELCDSIRNLWDREIKSSKKFIYRQATAKSEKNVINKNGWVMNPILNIQSMNPKNFGIFRKNAVKKILCSEKLSQCFQIIFEDHPKIVQSMYFEGNSATWEHQDSYYLDSEILGSMAAAWIALEDISPCAGRFFVCPGTHKIELEKQNRATNIVDNHDVYIKNIVDIMKEQKMEIRAPKLDIGDVLFWHAWTIHGSLNSQDEKKSRSSITAHAIPASHRFMQFQSRIIDVPTDTINKTHIWRPKDQASYRNRIIMFVESYFPGPFYALKNAAIKYLVR